MIFYNIMIFLYLFFVNILEGNFTIQIFAKLTFHIYI